MQRDSLQHAPHIIVATPGRLLDHLQKGTVSLDALNTLVMASAGAFSAKYQNFDVVRWSTVRYAA